jgi:hypothetical protein
MRDGPRIQPISYTAVFIARPNSATRLSVPVQTQLLDFSVPVQSQLRGALH